MANPASGRISIHQHFGPPSKQKCSDNAPQNVSYRRSTPEQGAPFASSRTPVHDNQVGHVACLSSQAGCGWTAIQWCVRMGFGSACVFFSTRSVSSCAASFSAAFFATAPVQRTMVLPMSTGGQRDHRCAQLLQYAQVTMPSAPRRPSNCHTIASWSTGWGRFVLDPRTELVSWLALFLEGRRAGVSFTRELPMCLRSTPTGQGCVAATSIGKSRSRLPQITNETDPEQAHISSEQGSAPLLVSASQTSKSCHFVNGGKQPTRSLALGREAVAPSPASPSPPSAAARRRRRRPAMLGGCAAAAPSPAVACARRRRRPAMLGGCAAAVPSPSASAVKRRRRPVTPAWKFKLLRGPACAFEPPMPHSAFLLYVLYKPDPHGLSKASHAVQHTPRQRSKRGRTISLPWKVWQSRTKSVQVSEANCGTSTASTSLDRVSQIADSAMKARALQR